jgi:hypothetical protein
MALKKKVLIFFEHDEAQRLPGNIKQLQEINSLREFDFDREDISLTFSENRDALIDYIK